MYFTLLFDLLFDLLDLHHTDYPLGQDLHGALFVAVELRASSLWLVAGYAGLRASDSQFSLASSTTDYLFLCIWFLLYALYSPSLSFENPMNIPVSAAWSVSKGVAIVKFFELILQDRLH